MFPTSRIISWIRGLLKEPQETASGTSEACSQVLKGDNQSQRGCGKLQRDNVQGNMRGKLQRKIEIQLQTTRLARDYRYVEKVFTNLRRKLNRTEDDDMFDLKTNVLIWWLFMSTTMIAAIHLGLEYDQILIACQNTKFEGIKTLFDISLMLVAKNAFEILNLSIMMYDFSPWMRNDFAPWSSDQMGQSKGTCPF